MADDKKKLEDELKMKQIKFHFHNATKYGTAHRVRGYEDEYYNVIKRTLPYLRKYKGTTKLGAKIITRKIAKEAIASGKLISRADKAAIKDFVTEHYLKDGGGASGEKKNVESQTALTEEQIKQNIKRSRRVTNTLKSMAGGQGEDEGMPSYLQRKFAAESGETKRDVAIKRINKGGSASIKADMQFLGKAPSASALSSDESKKARFAGKLQEKSTGFAGQTEKPTDIIKPGGGIASGIGSNPGGNGPIRL